jgi:hypothetical protein
VNIVVEVINNNDPTAACMLFCPFAFWFHPPLCSSS